MRKFTLSVLALAAISACTTETVIAPPLPNPRATSPDPDLYDVTGVKRFIAVPPPMTNHSAGIYVDPDTTKYPKGTATGVNVDVYQMKNVYDPNHVPPSYQVPVVAPIPPARAVPNSADIRSVAAFIGFNRLDPIVYPGVDGMAHLHSLWGLASLTKDTTGENIRNGCFSASRGGTLLCSAYWMPAMIDTITHLPILPQSLLVYYKGGNSGYMGLIKNGVREGDTIQVFPAGLVMVIGSAASTSPQSTQVSAFLCADSQGGAQPGYSLQSSIPDSCPNPDGKSTLLFQVAGPQCWDGKSLDSTDHKSHLAYPTGDGSLRTITCPSTHPAVLPQVTLINKLLLPVNGDISKWALSSDVYAADANGNVLPGVKRGYSGHGDWMMGIKAEVAQLWQNNCYAKKADCDSYTMGDGTVAGEFQGN